MNSENIFIVCDDHEGFAENLMGHLEINEASTSCDLEELAIEIEGVFAYDDVRGFHVNKTGHLKINGIKQEIKSELENPNYMEKVHEVFKRCIPNQVKFFNVTESAITILKENKCPFDLVRMNNVDSLNAQFHSIDPTLTACTGEKKPMEFDFIVIHGKFVAVLEVKGLANIDGGYNQLQHSAAFLECTTKNAAINELIPINRILCCPKFKRNNIPPEIQSTLISEKIFIVCDDGSGFENNLREVMNSLQENNVSRSWDLLNKLSQQLAIAYHEDVKTKPFRTGFDSEEIVYEALEHYSQDPGKYMHFFHSTDLNKLTKKHVDEISKDLTGFIPYRFVVKGDDNRSKSLEVLKATKAAKTNYDFIIIHKRFVAVLEVRGLSNIEYGYLQLQHSAAFVKSLMDGETDRVIYKILCCPMIKKVEMNDYAEKMSSENLFIVCGEGNGFEANLTDLLNQLEERSVQSSWDYLNNLFPQRDH